MNNPGCCPTCNLDPAPEDERTYASLECRFCNTHLWTVRHHQETYFYDSSDIDLFHRDSATIRAKIRGEYAAAGWIEWDNDERHPFHDLARVRKFSLQNQPLIQTPTPSIGLDFSDVGMRWPQPTEKQEFLEARLRQTLIECFVDCSSGSDCFAIDVNHSAFSFLPEHVNKHLNERWPISVVPNADYIAFNTTCFSQGILINPIRRTLVVYGSAFTTRFESAFPQRKISLDRAVSRERKTSGEAD